MRGRDVIAKDGSANRTNRPQSFLVRPGLLDPLFVSLRSLAGIGPKQSALFDRLLGRTPSRLIDLLMLKPRATLSIEGFDPDVAWQIGRTVIVDVDIRSHMPGRSARIPHRIVTESQGVAIDLVFFRLPSLMLKERYPIGSRHRLQGRLQQYGERLQIAHPQTPDRAKTMTATSSSSDQASYGEPTQSEAGTALIYPAVAGLQQRSLRTAIANALQALPYLADMASPPVDVDLGSLSFEQALTGLHNAQIDESERDRCLRRLAFDELVSLQLALAILRANDEQQMGRAVEGEARLAAKMIGSLPFSPTDAQTRAIAEISADMAKPLAMTRLLQGDVGSGKTVVALAAMLAAVEAGHQAALMAPTEILARQHARSVDALLAPLEMTSTLLIGSMPAAIKRQANEDIRQGQASIIVGTHALFQDKVQFHDLQLAVIDEQHRFGVHQRLQLRNKGPAPDLLLLTATPIPRSLIMTYYDDIAVSRLQDKPPGRQPVKTSAMPTSKIGALREALARELSKGGRIFWVCPLIDRDEADPEAEQDSGMEHLTTVQERYDWLCENFPELTPGGIEMVHGRLSAGLREKRMAAFAGGDARILVATTVIEVGVDVPDATVMVIENAERFGLAQLHQLRGRVGRGKESANCVLLYTPPLSQNGRARLDLMRQTEDGFLIAEEDLRLRGGGEVLGVLQSGDAAFRFADLGRDIDLLEASRQHARTLLDRAARDDRAAKLEIGCLLHLFDRSASLSMIDAG